MNLCINYKPNKQQLEQQKQQKWENPLVSDPLKFQFEGG